MWAIYAFCRSADDAADSTEPAAQRLAEIDEWQRRLTAAYEGRPDHPLTVAFADAVTRFHIPPEPALQLLAGARQDVMVRRYATYEELRRYCYLVASTVGLLVCPLLGYESGALKYGAALGRAMQLTNILRDVGEDSRLGRIYLPAEDLRRFGYSEERLLAGVVDADFIALMQFQIAPRAHALCRSGTRNRIARTRQPVYRAPCARAVPRNPHRDRATVTTYSPAAPTCRRAPRS